jgi:uncharacterized membrane protein YphA (DoxX/SURF4 family)
LPTGIVELAVGISLLIGLWMRPACILGGLFLLNMLLATWWAPGHGVPVWRYFGNELDHLPLLLLLIVFYAADAGRTWVSMGWCARIAVIAEKIFEEKGNRG